MYDFENMDKRLIAYVNIFVLANRLQAIMDKGLEEITAKQWLALTMIDAFEEAPTLKEMANLAGVTHQNMKQIVNKLEVPSTNFTNSGLIVSLTTTVLSEVFVLFEESVAV